MIRKHYHFTGDVQGVGFRYRAKYAADLLGVSGWVRNNDDGSVSMEAQGEPDALQKLTDLIAQGKYISIDSIRKNEIPVCEHEHGFYTID